MLADVSARTPEEACGLVAGRARRAERVYRVSNALHSPVRFRLDPAEQIHIFLEIEKLGLELVAIYHSHPNGPAIPSPTDVAESAYPETINLIWSAADGKWHCRGFIIQNGEVAEVPIEIVHSQQL